MLTLIQTHKSEPIPIVFVNKEFWQPLLDWFQRDLYEKNRAIDKSDMNIYYLVDTADEAYILVKKLAKGM